MTFQEIASEWLAQKEQSVKPGSLDSYRTALATTILPVLGEKEEIAEEDVRDFLATIQSNGVKASSFRNYVTIVRNVLRFGSERGWCQFPYWNVEVSGRGYKSERQPVLLQPQQEKKLVEYLIGTPSPRHLGIFLALSFGLRLGETCDLQWGAIDLEKRVLNVIEGPGQLRRIPIPEAIMPILTLCSYGKPGSAYVCTGTTEPVMSNKSLRDSLKAVSKRLDLPALIFQDLRHMFTVRCITSGCNFITLMSLLGYSSAQNLYDEYKAFYQNDVSGAMAAQAASLIPDEPK